MTIGMDWGGTKIEGVGGYQPEVARRPAGWNAVGWLHPLGGAHPCNHVEPIGFGYV